MISIAIPKLLQRCVLLFSVRRYLKTVALVCAGVEASLKILRCTRYTPVSFAWLHCFEQTIDVFKQLIWTWCLSAKLRRIAARLPKLLLLAISFSTIVSFAEGGIINREFQLKTVYLFHFAELAEWPSSLPVTVCLRGASPIRNYLPALEGQLIDGNPVHILLDQQTDLGACRILFLSDIETLTPELCQRANSNHVLLVSDVEGFAEKGGMVQFTLRDNKLKLVINLSAVKQAGLKFSSKLLRMAEILE